MPDRNDELESDDLTLILKDLASGKRDAGDTAMPMLVAELTAIARGYLRHQSPGHSLQPSALVNETYVKLFGKDGLEFNDRMHFFALAAKAMRQILVSHARKRSSLRGGGHCEQVSVFEPPSDKGSADVDVLDLHAALEQLTMLDERQGTIVELRYFSGLEVAEVAEVLGISKSTVEREWRVARAWLGHRMGPSRER
ncbi:MAG: sigma-70 family RNA polymerase sigma factor [bacterium]|nr:sigma-70 family RNA polymerase sigma factor [bacterium]